MIKQLFNEMNDYYRNKAPDLREEGAYVGFNEDAVFVRSERIISVKEIMDRYADEHPEESSYSLKAKLHEVITDEFEPIIFKHSPFFYETGMRRAMNWGTPCSCNAGSWLYERKHELFNNPTYEHESLKLRHKIQVDILNSAVDMDHYSLGYTKLLKIGIKGIMDKALEALNQCETEQEKDFIKATLRSLSCVIKIAAKFADKAEAMLKNEKDEQARKFLSMIAESAKHVPKNPPRTFYEGLAMMWFLRETCASLEGIGVSVIGHPDRVLIDLYKNDIASGRLTEAEAEDLVARWYMPTDVKWDLLNNSWPETSTTMTLGGCDCDGTLIYNEVTKLMLKLSSSIPPLKSKK